MVDNGSIVFDTIPSGARVYIDEEFFDEVTPLHITNASPGTYIIRVVHDKYTDFTSSLTVESNKITNIKVDLDKGTKTEEHTDMKSDEIQKIEIPEKQSQFDWIEEPELPPVKVPEEKLTEIDIYNLIGSINTNIDLMRQYMAKTSGFDTTQRYFQVGQLAITTNTPNKPGSPDVIACLDATVPSPVTIATSGYDVVPVNQMMGRNSPRITVINDGATPLFVITSSDGKIFNTSETPIYRGEAKRFLNVYEIRLRSSSRGILSQNVTAGGAVVATTQAGGIYRVTEHETEFALPNINRPDFGVRNQQVSQLGLGETLITITGNKINTTTAVRANVTNTDVIYITNSSGDITIQTQRLTLNPGDAIEFNIDVGAQIECASPSSGQFVEVSTEGDLLVFGFSIS